MKIYLRRAYCKVRHSNYSHLFSCTRSYCFFFSIVPRVLLFFICTLWFWFYCQALKWSTFVDLSQKDVVQVRPFFFEEKKWCLTYDLSILQLVCCMCPESRFDPSIVCAQQVCVGSVKLYRSLQLQIFSMVGKFLTYTEVYLLQFILNVKCKFKLRVHGLLVK